MPQLSDPTAAGIASGYRYRLLWPETFHAPYPTRMAPAGFLISSAGDMSHYLVAQLNGGTYEHSQVLSHQGIDMLHAPVARMSSSSSHGMGWAIEGAPGSMRIWHDREVSNFHSHLSLFPDRQLGIVVLINVGAFGNSAAINNLVEGIIARLLGRGHTAAAESPSIALSRLTTLVPLLVVTLWAAWSYRSLRGWRLYPALVIDVSVIGLIWIFVPARFQTPMATIALFAPDEFAILVTMTALAAVCAAARIVVALRSRRLRVSPTDHALAG